MVKINKSLISRIAELEKFMKKHEPLIGFYWKSKNSIVIDGTEIFYKSEREAQKFMDDNPKTIFIQLKRVEE